MDIYRWVFKIDIDDVKSSAYKEDGNTRPCALCGKSLKNKKRHYIHLIDNGANIVSSDQEFDGDLGFFEVGSACRKKLPNNFVWTE